MVLIFAYLAGLLTLINPCVLPILPIILASATRAGGWGPFAVAAGMSVSFVALGMLITVGGRALGIDEVMVSRAGAYVMLGFGLILLVPQFSTRFASATAGLSGRADAQIDALDDHGLGGQFLTGALMGAVWSPCIGPTLGAAIGLASQGQSLVLAAAIMSAFALGVSTIILALSYGTRSILAGRRDLLRAVAERSRPVLGAVFVIVGLGILFHWTKYLEIWALNAMPAWLVDLSVAL